MIFDKVYQVRWNNTPLGKSVTVFREKSSGWLFLPRHAEQTGDWVPFVSLDDDIKVMSSGEGDMEIIWEKDSMFRINPEGLIEKVVNSDEYQCKAAKQSME